MHVTQILSIFRYYYSGIALGAVAGHALSLFFETVYARKHYVRNSMKVILIL